MAFLGWLFIRHLFAPLLPADQIDSYIAGLILLGRGTVHRDGVRLEPAHAGRSAVHAVAGGAERHDHGVRVRTDRRPAARPVAASSVPWDTLLHVGRPLHRDPGADRAGAAVRCCWRGGRRPSIARWRRIGPWSIAALLATLVLLFAFQGEAILEQPLVIALLAVPILIQVLLQLDARVLAQPPAGREARDRLPVGAHRRQQLLRAGGRRRDQPVRLRFRRGAGHRGGRAHRGAGDAARGARGQRARAAGTRRPTANGHSDRSAGVALRRRPVRRIGDIVRARRSAAQLAGARLVAIAANRTFDQATGRAADEDCPRISLPWPRTIRSCSGNLLREVTRLYVRAQRTAADCCGTSPTQCQVITELAQTGPIPRRRAGQALVPGEELDRPRRRRPGGGGPGRQAAQSRRLPQLARAPDGGGHAPASGTERPAGGSRGTRDGHAFPGGARDRQSVAESAPARVARGRRPDHPKLLHSIAGRNAAERIA